MTDEHRKLAARVADEVAPTTGLVMVLIASESEPHGGPARGGVIEIDAAVRMGVAITDTGGLRLGALSARLRTAVQEITRELAEEWGATDVDESLGVGGVS